MDFDKFVHILATQSLWLTPLVDLDDRREGNWCDYTLFSMHLHDIYDHTRNQTSVSCWSMLKQESVYMWDLYTTPGKGIAISTTISGLESCCPVEKSTPGQDQFRLKDVRYEDRPVFIEIEPGESFDPLDVAGYKSADFKHESELRFIYSLDIENKLESADKPIDELPPPLGVQMPVDLEILIDKVHISPRRAPWLMDCAKAVLTAFGLEDISVVPSSLSTHFFLEPSYRRRKISMGAAEPQQYREQSPGPGTG
ncbi:hypothetical protein [Candidatus Poriferisocius sp.]|uniref:hypothetical protein n=1 Tax=Candidatus Poriferisocius sp. TaxID=3101276 RepID=UPI003B011DB5